MVIRIRLPLRVLFNALFTISIIAFIGIPVEITLNGFDEPPFLVLFGWITMGWMALYTLSFLRSRRIAIHKEDIVIRTWKNEFHNIEVDKAKIIRDIKIPQYKEHTLLSRDINGLTCGSLSKIREYCLSVHDTECADRINNYDTLVSKRIREGLGRISLDSKRYMYLGLSGHRSLIVDITDYNKDEIKGLVKILRVA